VELLQTRSLPNISLKKVSFRLPAIFWIVLAAFFIRVIFLVLVPPSEPTLEGDDGYYRVTALQIEPYLRKAGSLFKELFTGNLFHGKGILEKYELTLPWGALRRGPVYPFFLGIVFWIFGPNPFGAFIAQAFLVSLSTGFLYGIGKTLGQPGGGLVAASIFGVYPPAIFVSTQLLQESLAIFLFTLSYFLIFRLKKSSSIGSFVTVGLCLFLLSFSRSTLVFFPFFIGLILAVYALKKGRFEFKVAHVGTLIVSFLVPYLLWASFVSWQFHRPSLMGQPVDREMLSALLPEYDGWTPDAFMSPRADAGLNTVLEQKGISAPRSGMMMAALGFNLKNPFTAFKMSADKFRRLWWQPFDWPWRSFLFYPEIFRGFHRFLVLTSVGAGVLWWFQRRFAVGLLALAPLYGTLLHSFFHIESRYGLIYLPLLILFTGVFIHWVWKSRAVFLASGGKIIALLVGLAALYKGSHLEFLLASPPLKIEQAHFLSLFLQSLALVACFLAVGFWLKKIFPPKQLLQSLIVTAFVFFLPYEVYAFTSQGWREWRVPLQNSVQGVRQDIFLPEGSLKDAVTRNLRLDLAVPKEVDWLIKVNGQTVGDTQRLREKSPSFPFEGYVVSLEIERKKPFEMRQWHSLALPAGILKEGDFNQIEIVPRVTSVREKLLIYGDYVPASSSFTYEGPLFQRSPTETSIFKYQFDGDFRLKGLTAIHSPEVKASFFDGKEWRRKKGQYRLRIEIEKSQKEFIIF